MFRKTELHERWRVTYFVKIDIRVMRNKEAGDARPMSAIGRRI